jgi:hypothetical protein
VNNMVVTFLDLFLQEIAPGNKDYRKGEPDICTPG